MHTLLFVLITLLMFFLPNRLLTTEPVHEYLGCALLVLGGVHLWLERAYLRALFRRRLPMTALNTVNIIMLLLLAVTLVSGILISLYALPIVRLRGLTSIYVHAAHLSAGALLFLIVGVHVGLHARMLWRALLRRIPLHIPQTMPRILYVVGILLTAAGIHSFITTRIYDKILFEHLSFGGLAETWTYQCDLLLMFLACACLAIFYQSWRMRK